MGTNETFSARAANDPNTSAEAHRSTPFHTSPRSITNSRRQASHMSENDEGSRSTESTGSAETIRYVQIGDNLDGAGQSTHEPSSFDSYNTAYETTEPAPTPEHPINISRRSRNSSPSSSTRELASSLERRPRRPSATRRSSSIIQPHKGQEFSVDDEPSEVEGDLEQKQRNLAQTGHGSTGYGGMRRRSQLLRRRATQHTVLSNVESVDDEAEIQSTNAPDDVEQNDSDEEDNGTVRGGSYPSSEADSVESFTLKDRQEAINVTHPFGIRIWKPALYKKNRSVQRTAEGDIHSAPGGQVGNALFLANVFWVFLFGWWLSIAAFIAGITCYLFFFTLSGREYGRVLLGLAGYLLYPFGRFVELKQDEAYADEDEGEGRSISEYEQWQAGDIEEGRTFFGPHTPRSLIGRRRESLDSASESDSLLGAGERTGLLGGNSVVERKKRRLFGRGQWNIGRVLFFSWFYFVIAPMLLIVSGICWLLVFWIPMAKVTSILFSHLRRHPLALSFHSDHTYSRRPGTPSSSILLCTYRAIGWKYYKYTIDGTNIFFINLMIVVIFVIVDYFVLREVLGLKDHVITSPATIFALSLLSVIPLAYFIGQAVASISAQSSMGMGATINAFFSTIVEVYLYCVALGEGKGKLVEGSVVGSILVGVVFMPGLSMCSGAIKRKTQRFNAKSAGVTSTMLLFAVIGAFAPTLFYQIYGTYELSCHACHGSNSRGTDCRRCFFSQTPPTTNDRFYKDAVQPYTYLAALFLFISYVIGLWFTLRTHAAVIWQTVPSAPPTTQATTQIGPSAADTIRNAQREGTIGYQSFDSRTPASVRDSTLYKRILGQSLNNAGLRPEVGGSLGSHGSGQPTPHHVPPRLVGEDALLTPANSSSQRQPTVNIPGLSNEENAHVIRGVAEIAASAAAAAVQDAQRHGRKNNYPAPRPPGHQVQIIDDDVVAAAEALGGHGGHDAPNWSKAKSSIILLGATFLYAIIAEILVNTVDVVLENFEIDEKFLGITLFALVPNTTEFLNAISFAMNGNIALSMEIGSAYALQVCLLQIPALVAYSAWCAQSLDPSKIIDHTFSLIFPQWDLVTVILCVFLLSYMYGEGKSNYFKGSILILSYLTVMMGFYFSSYAGMVYAPKEVVILAVGNRGGPVY
ncbi:hypothetical protein RUND412_000320 [Rhizina undulata]